MPHDNLAWIEARKRHRLSHAHVQMARELGMNPKKLGKIDNHHQEPWKQPLPQFIERLYLQRFGRQQPEVVLSIEERARRAEKKKAERKAARAPRQPQRPLVSEYQYYEFLAIDRPLDDRQLSELRALSTRARISPDELRQHLPVG
ncbi:MAG: hypothetical protein ACRD0K_09550 [Egibacteraceae bacterium]